jgi:hypothetical protein
MINHLLSFFEEIRACSGRRILLKKVRAFALKEGF